MDAGVTVYNYMDTFFCCKVEKDKWCEEMVSEHMLVYLCSGELDLIAPDKKYHLKKGDSFFIKRNHLVRKIKQPSKNGEPFKGLFLQLKMPFLKRMLHEHNFTVPLVSNPVTAKSTYVMLEKHPFLNGLFYSLEQYFDAQQYPSKELMEVKLQEAVFTLLQLRPDLGQVLFDFAEPWKINLEDFMNKNYKCDLSVEDFAHYTGRSLSTFKKDFAEIFHNSAKRIYLSEIKRIIRIASSLGNELATVLIAAVCIALLVRLTLTDANIGLFYQNISSDAKIFKKMHNDSFMPKQHLVPFILSICILSPLHYHWSEFSCRILFLKVTFATKI